jgi:cell division ATPase FtsA
MRGVADATDTSLAVIDFGGSTSKLYIAERGVIQRLHRVQSGGSHATQKIATQLGCSTEDAENRKRNYATADTQSDVIKSNVEQTAFRALQEFKRVLDQHEVRVGKKIERLVITGGVALFPDFVQFVSYTLDREVSIINAFTKVVAPAFLEDTLKELAPSFTTALGAALRQFES